MGVDTNNRQKVEKLKALDTCSEAAAGQKKKAQYRNYLDKLFTQSNPDWNKIAQEIVNNVDTNYDGEVTAAEFAEALFLRFDVNPDADDRAFVEESLANACNQYNTNNSAGLDVAQMATCLQNKGVAVMDAAKELAQERKASTYDANIWDTILNGVDANGDGEVTTAEVITKLKAYFNITLTAAQETELTTKLNEAGARFDADGNGSLNLAEFTNFLKAHGQKIKQRLSYLKKAQA